MVEYRPFLNTDPPLLVDIWRKQQRFPALASTVSVSILEDTIFSKPYFQSQGLILAVESGQGVGFIHAGFATAPNENDLDLQTGIISQIRVIPCENSDAIIKQLVQSAIDYLKSAGATKVHLEVISHPLRFILGCTEEAGFQDYWKQTLSRNEHVRCSPLNRPARSKSIGVT